MKKRQSKSVSLSTKKGSTLRGIFAIIGAILFLLGLYLLNEDDILWASILGIAGILVLTVSVLTFIISKRQEKE